MRETIENGRDDWSTISDNLGRKVRHYSLHFIPDFRTAIHSSTQRWREKKLIIPIFEWLRATTRKHPQQRVSAPTSLITTEIVFPLPTSTGRKLRGNISLRLPELGHTTHTPSEQLKHRKWAVNCRWQVVSPLALHFSDSSQQRHKYFWLEFILQLFRNGEQFDFAEGQTRFATAARRNILMALTSDPPVRNRLATCILLYCSLPVRLSRELHHYAEKCSAHCCCRIATNTIDHEYRSNPFAVA